LHFNTTKCDIQSLFSTADAEAKADGKAKRLNISARLSKTLENELNVCAVLANGPENARDWGQKAWSRLRNPAAVGRTSPLKTAWLPCRRYSKTRSKDCFKGCSLHRAPEPELEKFLRDKVKSAHIFGTIPVAEALLFKGAQLGTVLAFMMAVTTLSLPSMIMLRKAVKPKLLGLFVTICTVGITLVGYLFNAFQFLFI